MTKYLSLAVCLLMFSFLPAKASGTEWYAIVNIASYHVNASSKFNEKNQGVSLGFAKRNSHFENWDYGAEIGFYKNSFYETSRYILAYSDFSIADIGINTKLRLGVFAGLFEYPTMTNYAERSGIPTFDDYVLIPGLSANLRFEQGYDLRLRIAPAAKNADAIATLQLALKF